MLFGVRVSFVLYIGVIQCAVRRFSDFENDNRAQKKDNLDSQASPNVIELEELDPRNQAVYSSYSVVETSGSASSAPKRVAYTKTEYEPFGENTEERPVGGGKRDRKNKFKFDDEEDTKSFGPLSDDDEINTSFNGDKKEKKSSGKDSRTPRRKESRERKPSHKSNPKSINEIVGHQPLQEAGSNKRASLNGDLKKSGTLLGGLGEGSFEDGEYDKEKHYDKEKGKKFIEAHKSEAGEKANRGYKKDEAYDKAEKENHGKEEKKAVVSEKEGEKKGHIEQEKVFGEEYKGKEGEKGISISKKGGSKKGHRKNGSHKVVRKDEYIKDEVFFDEADDVDQLEVNKFEKEKHSNEKGGKSNKAHVDSGYHEGHGEKKGAQEKGHNYEEATGHEKKAGKEAHEDQHSEYGKKGGVKEGEKHGYSEGGGSHHSGSDHEFF